MLPVVPKALSKRLVLPLYIALASVSCAQLSKQDSAVAPIAETATAEAAQTTDDQAQLTETATLVKHLKQSEVPNPAEASNIAQAPDLSAVLPIDLWQRLRDGFALTPESLPASVTKQRDWYLRNPSY